LKLSQILSSCRVRSNRILTGVASALVLGAVGVSYGGVTSKSADTYTLRAKYYKGELHTYGIQTAIYGITADNKGVAIQFDMRMHVLKVDSNKATIRLASGSPKNGDQVLPWTFKVAVVVLDQWNRPVGSKASGQIFSAYPSHPLKIGDTWEGTSNLTLSATTGALVGTAYRLNSVKMDGSRKIAEIGMKFSGLASGEGTELIDLADGSLLSSDLKLQLHQSKTIPIIIVMKRLT
jgi:hypothetical protein